MDRSLQEIRSGTFLHPFFHGTVKHLVTGLLSRISSSVLRSRSRHVHHGRGGGHKYPKCQDVVRSVATMAIEGNKVRLIN